MRILIIGDIVGRPGKHACAQIVPRLVRERDLDFVIANAENVAAGSGITPQIFAKLRNQGIDVCTFGDHNTQRSESYTVLSSSDRIVKPANLAPEAAGRDFTVVATKKGPRIGVISLLGRTYMNMKADCPFHAADRVLAQLPR